MADREKLQKGGPKRVRPNDTSFGEKVAHPVVWWKARHAAKKRRLAGMSRRRRVWRRVGLVATWLLGLLALVLALTVVLFYTLSDVPRPDQLQVQQAAQILYADGSVMATVGNQNRTLIKLEQVPDYVRWAVLAAEDRGFYSEPGFSVTGTIRAALSDLTGGDTQGGSGITQQYVKNAYLNDSRSLTRKLKELMISVKLARQYSKDQILEYYLNTVYFGRGAYGIEAASQTFFNRDVNALTVAQGAVLAAQLRAPSYYDPAENPQAAKERFKYVLDGMVATKHLTAAQEAKTTYPQVAPPPKSSQLGASGPTQLIVQRVLAELAANDISQDEINTRGLRILTTIDKKAQSAAENAVSQTFANLTQQQKNMKNALVAVNPSSGAVLAYYGGPNGKNYAGQPDYIDYAGQGLRPPGSSFKPYTLATVLQQTVDKAEGKKHLGISSYVNGSQCVMIQGKQICNDPSDAPYSKPSLTLANAIKYSLNTTFDLLAVEAGPNEVAKTAHAAGISKSATLANADGNTGFGIGIGDYSVHTIDQAVGFATFANAGVRNAPFFVQKATDSSGGVVYKHKSDAARALDQKVANDVTLAMEPIAGFSGDPLDNGRVSAAKTGTEGIEQGADKGRNSDAWMVGYTPQVSTAVWVGSGDSNHAIYNSYGGNEYGRDLPGRTWKLFMDTYLAGQPNLPMATTQQIKGSDDLASRPAPSPTKTQTTSATPTPTFSRSTGFPTPTPTLTPTPTPTPTRTSPTPTSTCTTGVIGPPASCTP